MKLIKSIAIFFLSFLLYSGVVYAQKKKIKESDYQNSEVEMADHLRAEGKIYVVVAVVITILAGLIAYTLIIDRKITKLEKQFNQNSK